MCCHADRRGALFGIRHTLSPKPELCAFARIDHHHRQYHTAGTASADTAALIAAIIFF